MTTKFTTPQSVIIGADQLDRLIKALSGLGYQVIGPKLEDDAVQLLPLTGADELPLGVVEEQAPGTYRLKPAKTPAYFDFTHGAHTWKQYLFPPKEKLWSASKTPKGLVIDDSMDTPKYAFIGVRACELAALGVQDQVFVDGEFASTPYKERRERVFIVALNCRRSGGTCFCVSQNTGPNVKDGYDLALTEITDKAGHRFVVEVGSSRGEEFLAKLETSQANDTDLKVAKKAVKKAAKSQDRTMPANTADILLRNQESTHWQDVAKRCLDCGNCTFVCPTCFCSTTTDETNLDGDTASRWRQWDSCFTLDFSYIHGGSIRRDGAERYRQWISHKLTHWHDQFGVSGCVGCGRCITWCPVGIDITEEVKALAKGK
ncbi:MAG: 4Fe-4S dicluster domain-containing protein [Magnetovibrio sp.]|nr:4Fe-4S dicluster domain-containing protein [Magnetovibrio sp.]